MCVERKHIPIKRAVAYEMLILDKENLSNQWKRKRGTKCIVNVKALADNVFNNLNSNISQTTPDTVIEEKN